jgi:hypothetical protein
MEGARERKKSSTAKRNNDGGGVAQLRSSLASRVRVIPTSKNNERE